MKIILDFDDTILNTHNLMRDVCAVFSDLGFQEEQFWGAYAGGKEKMGDFNPEMIIDLLNEIKPFDKTEAKKKINLILDNSKNFVYPDFFDFAKSFDKKDLILLSFATTATQEVKINNSKITDFFENTIITSRDKAEDVKPIFEKYKKENIFFIDDKTSQIDNIKSKFPEIITMKIKRPQGVDIMTESKLADHTINDLNEAKDIINDFELRNSESHCHCEEPE